MTLVHDGTRTWLATPESGVVEHESQAMRPIGDELLDPATFLPGFDFRIAGDTEVAGRPALAVGATPRPRGAGPADLFPYGADALSLAVDRERGVILRFEASSAGEAIRRLEVSEISFDEPFANDLFTVPAGDVRSAEEAFPMKYVTLEQAARDASFQVWTPARLGGRWNVNVIHRPETSGPRVPESVMLLLHDSESLHNFGIEEAAERLLAWRTGEERIITVGGEELRVIGGERLPGPRSRCTSSAAGPTSGSTRTTSTRPRCSRSRPRSSRRRPSSRRCSNAELTRVARRARARSPRSRRTAPP